MATRSKKKSPKKPASPKKEAKKEADGRRVRTAEEMLADLDKRREEILARKELQAARQSPAGKALLAAQRSTARAARVVGDSGDFDDTLAVGLLVTAREHIEEALAACGVPIPRTRKRPEDPPI